MVTVQPADADGHLLLDGEEQGRGSSFRLENVQAKSALLTYESEGYHNWQQNIELQPNQTHHVFITMQKNKTK